MKVLIDTNILLDLILEREPFVEATTLLFKEIEQGQVQGYIAATSITNIFYIIRKAQGREIALQAISRILQVLEVCAVNRQTIELALNENLKDFEDGIQVACATLAGLDAVVTRDKSDFVVAKLPVFSAEELAAQLSQNRS